MCTFRCLTRRFDVFSPSTKLMASIRLDFPAHEIDTHSLFLSYLLSQSLPSSPFLFSLLPPFTLQRSLPLSPFFLLSQLLFVSPSISLSPCLLTHSIRPNDSSEWFEWTHNLNSLVGFEILQLQSVEVPHSFYLPSFQVHSSKPRAYTVTHRR